MKTPDKPLSSKTRVSSKDAKDEESAPSGKSPMARFRSVASSAISANPEKVRELERDLKTKRDKS
jgi:hypothetical protein